MGSRRGRLQLGHFVGTGTDDRHVAALRLSPHERVMLSSSGDPPEAKNWEPNPSNLAWVEELYYAYRNDPTSVDEEWRRRFELMDGGAPVPLNGNGHPPAPAAPQLSNGNGH